MCSTSLMIPYFDPDNIKIIFNIDKRDLRT